MAELTKNRLSPRAGYALLTLTGLVLTWSADVFEIISYASRAFAAYYALQCALAATACWRLKQGHRRVALYAGLSVLGLAIVLFGQAVEGNSLPSAG